MSVSWPHVFAVWRRNWTLYGRTWKYTILPNFFEPVFYLTAIGIGVGAYITEMAGMSYIQFLAPGMLCVAAMLAVAACEPGVSPSSIEDLHGGWHLVAFELDDGTVIRPSGAGGASRPIRGG